MKRMPGTSSSPTRPSSFSVSPELPMVVTAKATTSARIRPSRPSRSESLPLMKFSGLLSTFHISEAPMRR